MSTFSTVVLFLGGAATVIASLLAVYKIAKRVEQAIGTDEKGRTLSQRLDRVEHQLWENGGSSLADRVNKIEACSIETSTEVKFIKELIITNSTVKPLEQKQSSKKPRISKKPA